MENKFYVYRLTDPRTNLPFYIGKGCDYRCYKHLTETAENTENYKKYCYIQGLRNKGYEPIVEKIKEHMSESDAYDLETELIQQYGRIDIDLNGILTNICLDNRPPRTKWTDERRKKTSEFMKGNKNWSRGDAPYPESAKKIISRKLRENHPNRGKTAYSVFVKKYGEEQAAIKWNEMIKKRSDANTGRIHTAESKENMKKAQEFANKGRIHITLLGETENQYKFINPSELAYYLNNGWVKGRIGFSAHKDD